MPDGMCTSAFVSTRWPVCNRLSLRRRSSMLYHSWSSRPTALRQSGRVSPSLHDASPVIYVYTHDSVYLGGRARTSLVEHLSAMRAMPGLWVVDPADAHETAAAWRSRWSCAGGPVALCLTRQGVPTLSRRPAERRGSGGAALRSGRAQFARGRLGRHRIRVSLTRSTSGSRGFWRSGSVVSLPCWERFLAQDAEYRSSVLPAGNPRSRSRLAQPSGGRLS